MPSKPKNTGGPLVIAFSAVLAIMLFVGFKGLGKTAKKSYSEKQSSITVAQNQQSEKIRSRAEKSKAAIVISVTEKKSSTLFPKRASTDVCKMSRRGSSSKTGDQSPGHMRNVTKSATYNTLMDKAMLAKNVSY